MKKRIVTYLIIVIVTFPSISISQSVTFDGNYWMRLDELSKLTYVVGMVGGLSEMRDNIHIVLENIKGVDGEKKKVIKEVSDHLTGYPCDVTYGQLIDGIDTFYKDFRNRQIEIIKSFIIVRRQIKGDDEKLINEYIQKLRKSYSSKESTSKIEGETTKPRFPGTIKPID